MKAAALSLLLLAATPSDEVTMTATSVNVAEPGTPVKIRILRWSTDEERAPMLTALQLRRRHSRPHASGAPAEAARGRGAAAAGRGRGRGRGAGRGSALVQSPRSQPRSAARRRSATSGRTTSRATRSNTPGIHRCPTAPIASSSRRTAVSARTRTPGKPRRRRAADTDYTFTLIELRAGPKGMLEGKTSLTSKIADR